MEREAAYLVERKAKTMQAVWEAVRGISVYPTVNHEIKTYPWASIPVAKVKDGVSANR